MLLDGVERGVRLDEGQAPDGRQPPLEVLERAFVDAQLFEEGLGVLGAFELERAFQPVPAEMPS